MPGDPIRHVDWKVYAKSDRFYIKEYEQETNLRAYLLLDVSSSTPFAEEGRIEKLRYGTYLGAALAYLMLQQQDAVGLLTFSDQIHRIIPARSARTHLRVLFGEMETALRGALASEPKEDPAEQAPTSARASSSSPTARPGAGS